MANYIPNSGSEFLAWFQNFVSTLEEFTTQLGITSAEYDELSGFLASFSIALTDLENKRAQAKAATQTKDSVLGNAISLIRALVRRIQAHPATTDAMRTRLGITIPENTRSTVQLFAPVNLVAMQSANGRVRLDWDANGNGRIIYIIETKADDAAEFTLLGISTRLDYIYEGLALGERAAFRVRARNNDELSAPSNVAVVGM